MQRKKIKSEKEEPLVLHFIRREGKMKILQACKSVFIVAFIVGLVFSASTPASAYQWPSTLTISTTGTATSVYAQTLSWSALLEEQTKTKVRVIPSDN